MVARVRGPWKALGLAVLCGCGGDDNSTMEVSSRAASSAECAAGGTVVVVGGESVATVCNGADGRDGEPGLQGERGTDGVDGSNGVDGAAGPAGATSQLTSEIVGRIAANESAIVIVECIEDQVVGHGTGTKTSTGTIITAQHVVEDMSVCRAYSASPIALLGTVTSRARLGRRDEVELTMDWTAQGLAVAGLEPQRSVIPSIGDMVTVVGHPGVYDGLALEHQYTTGSVTATNLHATLTTVPALEDVAASWEQSWSTDAVAWHGNSGGPVFDSGGNWIGILVGGLNGNTYNSGPDLSIVLPLF
ncbi:MAG: Trypsin-like peptidase domain [Pseudomonadota bacterium]|jgi:S1-C subfamily serine protease